LALEKRGCVITEVVCVSRKTGGVWCGGGHIGHHPGRGGGVGGWCGGGVRVFFSRIFNFFVFSLHNRGIYLNMRIHKLLYFLAVGHEIRIKLKNRSLSI